MDYEKLCSDIFKLDPRIRYVAISDESAKLLAGGMRKGLKSYLPESLEKVSVDQAIMRWQTRLRLKDWIGLPKYAVAEYEKIKRFTFYLKNNKLLVISTEPDVDIAGFITKVSKILSL